MRNFVQPGDSLAVGVSYAAGVIAGQDVVVDALFRVAAFNGAQNAVIEAATQGVFDPTKESPLNVLAGPRVFWDNTNRRVATTATGNFSIGIVTQATLAAEGSAAEIAFELTIDADRSLRRVG